MKLNSFFAAFLLVVLSFFGGNEAFAGCAGQTITCIDGCSHRNITVYNADTCSFTYDSGRGCNVGGGYCSDASSSPRTCQGDTVTCFDGCSGRNITATNADTCGYTYDSGRGCNSGYGYCSGN